ncbi:transcriptional regulator, LacI family [Nocardioides terrae]|uniref:Transcriptional regulator, LacI family n=1 Tax=Nocardioides terrae TaxID=574651 RepID=A0A1I1IUC8_9ACTN|nr:LacI family DNA-binding transcriptional regulator [Nocardioides terrae]SFC39844.1 transcriptional regulator, LacI family [Nocardioides terrae]
MPSPRPTSRDVAQAAGVSQAAVSMVLGEKWRGRVSAATAARVREAAATLGYRPNLAARQLRLGSARTLLLVVPALTTEYFADLYAGAARAAAEQDFGVILYLSPTVTAPARDPFASAQSTVDGVLASSMSAEALSTIRGDRLPLVMLDSSPDAGAPTVNVDLADGARQAVEHLLGHGHRRFVHLSADVPSWTFEVRAGAVAARLASVPDASLRVVPTALTVPGGAAATAAALDEAGPRPTALVCDDDRIAAGAYKELRRRGLQVPQDVSVVALDDFAVATAVDPELTAVRFDAELFGERGVRALLALIAGADPDDRDVPVQLVVRGSTGAVSPG